MARDTRFDFPLNELALVFSGSALIAITIAVSVEETKCRR